MQTSTSSPRGLIKLNGTTITGWITMEVENNNLSSADTFRCTFAGGLLPKDRDHIWFSQQQDMFVELFIGFPHNPLHYTAADLKSWVYGRVDDVEIDPVTFTITVSGRDLTSMFIDTKTTEKWPNRKAHEIVTALAQRHGLNPVVANTIETVGKYYQIDHVHMADERSEWDILLYLAAHEGYKVWMRGQSLYFQPAPPSTTATPYRLIWSPAMDKGYPSANFQSIQMSRVLTVSRGIQVSIRSWNKKFAKGFTVNYPSTKSKTAQPGSAASGIQTYVKDIPNLTRDQALQQARNWYQQLISHEMRIEVTLPGDNDIDISSVMQLSGTGTAFDQRYYPSSITRTLSFDGGYSMRILAKNHAPDSEVQL
ncbi:phage late control D family protein [Chromobacterium violaceum]|uniref:phage late control D family protein n=1 Tax=Chromobacterium violaceum TaxID=536 RepID=UPI001B3337C4|nr:phage late control D family protein [Chromobacterium violaceum]MBP4043494.1 phage late control D family protein [Chromobacterium violaceum]